MKKYSIGLDIGTTSVGWAVVDEKTFKIIKKYNCIWTGEGWYGLSYSWCG